MEERSYIDPNQLAINFISTSSVTPSEKTEVKVGMKNFEIETKEILSVLNKTTEKYFSNIDYSFLTDSKSILSHFYFNEKECLSQIQDYPYYKRKFYKLLIYDSIHEAYKLSPEKATTEIDEKLGKIRLTLNKMEIDNADITLEKFNEMLKENFGTIEIPKFLIRDDIKFIKYHENLKKNDKKRPELDKIISIYEKLKNGIMKPFKNFKNINVLFTIFVLSNSKDISNNEYYQNIFYNNYHEILLWFNVNPDMKNYNVVLNTFCYIQDLEKNNLLESFFIPVITELNEQKNRDEMYLYLIASFFFCIIHKMKDLNDNKEININNSRIIKFLTNVLDSFNKYIKMEKFNNNYLINGLFIHASHLNDKIANLDESALNQDYNFEKIEKLLYSTNNKNLIERFNQIKQKFKLEPVRFSGSLVGTILSSIVNYFSKDYYYYSNFIRLSPLQKYYSSNTVTIFVSGFGSENDIHSIEWKKYIYNNPTYSNYYFYHWPGDSFAKIVIKSLPIGINGFKFDSDLPKVFMESKEKAKFSGKLLSLILTSKKFFPNCQIDLVAFSLGSHLVKHCLKETYKKIDEVGNIINDIVFMGSATSFKKKDEWCKIFKRLVSGRIINCYSESDYILKYLYTNCTNKVPNGSQKIDINDGKGGQNIIENYDFTDLNMGHLDYRDRFEDVLKRIKYS